MLDKDSNTKDTYKLSPHTSIVVNNKRVEPDSGDSYYNVTVTIKHKMFRQDHGLAFGSPDEVDKFVNGIDFEDPQTKIPGIDGLPVGHDRKDLN